MGRKMEKQIIDILYHNAQKIYLGKLPEALEEPASEILALFTKEMEKIYQLSQNIKVEYKDGQAVDLLVSIATLRDKLLYQLKEK